MTDTEPHLTWLTTWARSRGLIVSSFRGTQREPENIVAIRESGGVGGPGLISRQSRDSVDTAAMYVLHTLKQLGIDTETFKSG